MVLTMRPRGRQEQGRRKFEGPTMVGLAFILFEAEWQNRVRGGYEAEFEKGTFVFFCRRLSLSRRAGEHEPPSIDEDEYYLWTVR